MSGIDYSILDPIEIEVIRYVLRKEGRGETSALQRETIPLNGGFCGPDLGVIRRLLPDYMVRDFAGRNRSWIWLPGEALPGSNWQFRIQEDASDLPGPHEDDISECSPPPGNAPPGESSQPTRCDGARPSPPGAGEDDRPEFLSIPEEYDFNNPDLPLYAVSRPAIWRDRRAALIFLQWIAGPGGIRSDYILLNYHYRLERWYRLRRIVAGLA